MRCRAHVIKPRSGRSWLLLLISPAITSQDVFLSGGFSLKDFATGVYGYERRFSDNIESGYDDGSDMFCWFRAIFSFADGRQHLPRTSTE